MRRERKERGKRRGERGGSKRDPILPLLEHFCWCRCGRGGGSAGLGCWWPRSQAGSSGCVAAFCCRNDWVG